MTGFGDEEIMFRVFNNHAVAVKKIHVKEKNDAAECVDEGVDDDRYQSVEKQGFISELSVFSSFNDDGIVMVYGISIHEGCYYIVMEKGEGHLKEKLAKEEVDYETKKRYICQIACGLLALWKKDIYHGDLKLDNILLVNGECKLTDFGISKIITSGIGSGV